ncbi:MAG: fimbria/pilus outer membrane usher protein [Stenotrophomonas sp.]|uniref:fimbria/pilus outer membrane usher protein n=1 Tax=Stenotrophomonas sp. TaxID=69392 RepID=UPI003D6CEEE6
MKKLPKSPPGACWFRTTGAVVLSMYASVCAQAEGLPDNDSDAPAEVEFNTAFIRESDDTAIDLARFNKGNQAPAGTYLADVVTNGNWSGRADVELRARSERNAAVVACFDRALLELVGVDLGKIPTGVVIPSGGSASPCVPLSDLVPGAFATFDNGEQRLLVTVPQAFMRRSARGYVDPQYWDEGITSARLQYNANAYQSNGAGQSVTRGYVGLDGGVNVGAWRLRSTGSLTADKTGAEYQGIQTNLSRAIPSWKSRLVLGDTFTDGMVFDSVGLRGAVLSSDDRMRPESQRGYAPTIRGIAESNALVQIRQHGNVLYETTVAPGAFEIDDLYPTGYGGELEVVVTEADGRVRISTVPFARAVNALRPGVTRYSAGIGQYRDASVAAEPLVSQFTLQHGFSNLVTGYGGAILADGYTAGAAGIALNTRIGAFSADVTHAVTRVRDEPQRAGQSYRLAYSTLFAPTDTSLTLAAYRYSSSGYLDLPTAMRLHAGAHMGTTGEPGVRRDTFQLALNQRLPAGFGAIYASGSAQGYWGQSQSEVQYQAGYSNSYKRLNYGVSASRQFLPATGRWDNAMLLTLSLPLSSSAHAPYTTTSVQSGPAGATSVRQALTGVAAVDEALTYGLSATRTTGDGRSTTRLSGNAAYVLPKATLSASVGSNGSNRQLSAGASGMVVAYSGGLAFSPTGGDTIAIIEAAGAGGARVANGNGLLLDSRGRAVVSNLIPFASNSIEIDPKGLPLSVELKGTEARVVPTDGAVVLARIETESGGRSALIQAQSLTGSPLPFGAEVLDAEGGNVGTVAQAGRIVVRRLKSTRGTLTVRWGQGAESTCQLNYTLPDAVGKNDAMTMVKSECQ